MSLVLAPKGDAADDYHVLHGELQVGQIYKRKAAIRPEAQWLWALNGVPEGPHGLALTGLLLQAIGTLATILVLFVPQLVLPSALLVSRLQH